MKTKRTTAFAAFTITVDGLAELKRGLNELPTRIQKNVLRTAIFRAAQLIRDEAKMRVPKDTWALHDSIKARRRRGTPTEVRASVDVGEYYGWMVEYGYIKQNGKHHGARPYMVPAFEARKGDAVGAFEKGVRDETNKKLTSK